MIHSCQITMSTNFDNIITDAYLANVSHNSNDYVIIISNIIIL